MREAGELEALLAYAVTALEDVLRANLAAKGEFGFLSDTSDFHLAKAIGHIAKHQIAEITCADQDEDHLGHALTRIAMAMAVEDLG